MADPVQSFTFAKSNLTEALAKQVQDVARPLVDNDTRKRRWVGIPSKYKDECINYLRSILNVQDPLIEREKVPGLFRVIDVHSEAHIQVGNAPGSCDIFQVLKRGWLTTINVDAAKWTDAKWVKHEVSQQVGNAAGNKEQVLHVIFRDVSPQHLGAIGTALQAQTTFTDPVIFGEKVEGTFSVYLVKPSTETDGSGIVEILMGNSKFQIMTFGNLDTPREYDEINLYGVAKDLQVGIIAAWKALAVKGSYSYPRYDSANHTVDLTLRTRVSGKSFTKLSIITSWDGFTKTYEDVYFGLTEAEADLVGLGSPATWLITTTYPIGTRVSYLGYYYVSLKASNLGYTPIGNPTWWKNEGVIASWPPQGQAWTCNKRYDESDAMWTVFVTREFALAVNVAESIVQRGERETVHESEGIHDLTKPVIAAAVAGTNFALSINLDRFLTWNWKKRRRVSKFPFSGEVTWKIWGWYQYITSQVYSETLGRYWNDHTYKYHVYAEHTKKYFTNETEARAYIHDANGKEAVVPATTPVTYTVIDTSGSRVSHEGDYLYAAIKVRNKKSLISTTNYLEPTS